MLSFSYFLLSCDFVNYYQKSASESIYNAMHSMKNKTIAGTYKSIPYSLARTDIAFLKNIRAKLNKGVKTSVLCSSFSLKAMVMSYIYNDKTSGLIVCPEESDARNLKEDIETFCRLYGKDSSGIGYIPPRPAGIQNRLFSDSLEECSRIACLDSMKSPQKPFLITASLHTVMQKTLPPEEFLRRVVKIKAGIEIPFDRLITSLIESGYSRESLCERPGQFASRGGIIDMFSPGMNSPVRLEFLGDEVESIRYFDPGSQLSRDSIGPEEISILPAKEIILTENNIRRAHTEIRKVSEKIGVQKKNLQAIFTAIDNRNHFDIPSNLLPAFYETAGLFDYLPDGAMIALVNFHAMEDRSRKIEQQAYSNYQNLAQREEPAFSPDKLYLGSAPLNELLNERSCLRIDDIVMDNIDHTTIRSIEVESKLGKRQKDKPLEFIINLIKENTGKGIATYLFYEHFSSCEKVLRALKERKLSYFLDPEFEAPREPELEASSSDLFVIKGKIEKSFELPEESLCFVDETSLFGRKRFSRQSPKVSRSILTLREIKNGDFVVHTDHGIARYDGLKHLTIQGIRGDFLHLTFSGDDKLYLPVHRMNLISKYVGSDARKPRLSSLGSKTWEKAKANAAKAISQMAADLIKLYAGRKIIKGHAYSATDKSYYNFESLFPYDETPDQKRAIEEVGKDMESPSPMDRLICGDVGFGKTEVALRASYRAAMDGKQTAVLVPTTVLAQQHYENFKERFKDYPINVDFLSRFKSRPSQLKCLKQISAKETDIIIGTHRMLSKDVQFKDLGLLIIDEEHRFGVKHKERIKKLRSSVDVLALSATPIPRSLEMSLVGMRDLSIINSPPADRKAIKTFISKYDDEIIRQAIEKEISRGGQVFFVHNRIESIDALHSRLKTVVPNARIVVAHGRMKESRLEKVMLDFLKGKYDVLLSTAIIESGLDIPRANTIIINRADLLGLAQLYQLRGRVGRAKDMAYAYLLLPSSGAFKPEAIKRLKVLRNFTELGSGIKIALHDLEIRGAGNIFGESQSGHISALGLELYTKILERTIKKLKKEEESEEFEPELNVNIEAFIADTYIPDIGLRLSYYKRLAEASSQKDIEQIRVEMTDRFGSLPERLKLLLEIASLKVLAKNMHIKELSVDKKAIYFRIQGSPDGLTEGIVDALKNEDIKYTRDGRMRFELKGAASMQSIGDAKKMLQGLSQYVT